MDRGWLVYRKPELSYMTAAPSPATVRGLAQPAKILPFLIWAVDAAVIIIDGIQFRKALGRSRVSSGPQLKLLAPQP